MSRAEPKPPSSPASKGWYDTLISGVGALDALPTGFDIGPASSPRWMGWRLRSLVWSALIACLTLFLLLRAMSLSPWIDAEWAADSRGRVVLKASDLPELSGQVGQGLAGFIAADGRMREVDEASLLQRAPRWQSDLAVRNRLIQTQQALNEVLAQGRVTLVFVNGREVSVPFSERGFGGMGWAFWPLAALVMVITLVGAVVWLARPDPRNAFYLVLTLCQGGNLAYIALQTVPGFPLPASVMATDLPVRLILDLVTAATMVHVFTIHPWRLNYGPLIAAGSWLLALAAIALVLVGPPNVVWWGAQLTVLTLGVSVLLVLTRSQAVNPNPFTATMRRLGLFVVGSMVLLLLSLAFAGEGASAQHRVAEVGSAVWTIFLASVLLLVPFLTRSRQLLREFALLAGISTVATSLDLMLVAVFSLGQFASVAVAVFLSLGVYAFAREWIVNQLTGSQALTLDRIFERLYRVGRAIEQEPERRQELMQDMLRDLFEPLEMQVVPKTLVRSRVVAEGAGLMIPAPADNLTDFDGASSSQAQAWLLLHAHKGRRLFTGEDARLADRIGEHLRRAVVYDKAVERGRAEERRRIAQDLHDDIGARLLTLMYKAHTPELEDYLRHTLQDLKTLTRGLAASEHQLSHAIGEWKADIGQRLAAAQIGMNWSFTYDRDLPLTVVQWSGLTRILRELVTNAIYHAQATRLDVEASVDKGRLNLWIADDGKGRDPSQWSHGLGLGGVRKRVRMLGGVVRWRENSPKGIICEVQIDHLDQPPAVAARSEWERETRF
jgi:signal transduction histidine kinase